VKGNARRRNGENVEDSLWALREVSLQVGRGEVVGIIGRNGAGKSTLLKILSRITEPTSGRVELRGRIGSLLEVGTGFHPELTGRENVYLNGAILGMTRREVNRKFDEIVAFSEVEKFLDMPVKRYSSGMYVRLAFAVAAHLSPNILLIDEVLAVGDLAFQRKCLEHTAHMKDRNATVLLISHNMFAIKSACDRAIYLSGGRVSFDGPTQRAIEMYEAESQLDTPPWAQERIWSDSARPPVHLTGIEPAGEDGIPRRVFEYGERMRIRIHYEARERIAKPNFVVAFVRSDNVTCCNHSSVMDGLSIDAVSGCGVIEAFTPPLKLVCERYSIQVLVWDAKFHRLYSAQTCGSFHVRHELLSSTHFGVFHEAAEWSWIPDAGAA
jgi:lipopolysaccharide transport system ATP-binding protein